MRGRFVDRGEQTVPGQMLTGLMLTGQMLTGQMPILGGQMLTGQMNCNHNAIRGIITFSLHPKTPHHCCSAKQQSRRLSVTQFIP